MSEQTPITIVEFYDLCERHDWTYQYSDDNRVYQAGQREREHLNRIASPHPEMRKLFTAFSNYIFKREAKPERPS